MWRFSNAALVLSCLWLLGCSDEVKPAGDYEPRELTQAEVEVVAAGNEFGIELFKEISRVEGEENVFISPISVSMALGMTLNGAEGTTEEAMRDVLEVGDLSRAEVNESYKGLIELLLALDPDVELGLANSIWHRLGMDFKEEFLNVNRTYFDAQVTGLDFDDASAAPTINNWVNESTNGRIEEIVDDPISQEMIMFLINVIYFKGAWTYEFDPEETKDDMFTLPDGSKRACRMMTQESNFRYQRTPEFQAVDLPYGNGDFSMVVVLPTESTDLKGLTEGLTDESWGEWLDGFMEEEVTLELPKFTAEYEIGLKEVLTTLGMGIAFSPTEADFTRLYESPLARAFISSVKHKTFVKVDESGTEAAAATSVGVGATGLPPIMRVDRPFLFAIRDAHSGTILFIGKIVEPTLD